MCSHSGTLASGDTHGRIYTYRMGEGGVWTAATRAFDSHKKSVEDVQWSPNEPTVLASVSVDRTLRMWDTRMAPAQANVLIVADAHTDDINVLSWNTLDPNLLLSGGDDNMIRCVLVTSTFNLNMYRVWDVRRLAQLAQPSVVGHTLAVGTFSHHTAAITSVQWSPQVHITMLLCDDLLCRTARCLRQVVMTIKQQFGT
jgi:ribosome assembly protein RRB1